jgi:hypothetical protein
MASLSELVGLVNQGAIRNRPITPFLQQSIGEAVNAVYGPGYRAEVFSGGQKGQRRTGTVRHDHGRAADIHIIGPDGRKISGDALAPLGQYWAAKKIGGVGMEMHGGGIHLDQWSAPPRGGGMSWNYAKQGGRFTPEMQRALSAGLEGQFPSSLRASPQSPVALLAPPLEAPAPPEGPMPIMKKYSPARPASNRDMMGRALSMLSLMGQQQPAPPPLLARFSPPQQASLADFMQSYS